MRIVRLTGLVLFPSVHNACFLILRHAGFEEVRFVTERDAFHPVEGVGGVVDLSAVQGDKQSVRHEFDVRAH